MPEIPEVELYKDNLSQTIVNKFIHQVMVYREKSINLPIADFNRALTNARIIEIQRRGKYIIIVLDQGYLLAHMMLDGRLFYLSPQTREAYNIPIGELDSQTFADSAIFKERIPALPGKPSVLVVLNDGSLLFFCQLTLGYLHYLDKHGLEQHLSKLGREPLDPSFQVVDFKRLLQGKRGMIKPWLMDQKNLAGIGNAYSNEALFKARILPTRQIRDLSESEIEKLYYELQNVLRESIAKGGDMEEPFSPDDQKTGGFNPFFAVYDRENEPCPVCSEMLHRKEVGGRNAFYCVNCQH